MFQWGAIMRRLLASAAAAAAICAAPAAQAAVTYEFTGMQTLSFLTDPNDDPETGAYTEVEVHTSFTLTRATFITNGTFVADACSDDNAFFECRDLEFNNFPNQFDVGGDFLAFGHTYDDGVRAFGGGAFYFFASGAFGAVGTYTTDGWPINGPPIAQDPNGFGCCFGNAGFATLTVSGSPDSGVPEPTAWALMIAGFGGLGAMLRRRRPMVPDAAA